MELEGIIRILQDYNNLDVISKQTLAEIRVLQQLKEEIEWGVYNSKEKYEIHSSIKIIANKVESPQAFEFELHVLKIFELIESLIVSLGSIEDSDHKKRLGGILMACKHRIQEFRDLRRSNLTTLQALHLVQEECLANNQFKQVQNDLCRLQALIESIPAVHQM